jgi:hypothetical protein
MGALNRAMKDFFVYVSDTTQDITNQSTSNKIQIVTIPLCPDLLRYDQLGAADNLRGRVIRAFFWLMRIWPV